MESGCEHPDYRRSVGPYSKGWIGVDMQNMREGYPKGREWVDGPCGIEGKLWERQGFWRRLWP